MRFSVLVAVASLVVTASVARADDTVPGPARASAERWFVERGPKPCYAPKEDLWGKCHLTSATAWKATYDGDDAVVAVTWLPDPTGNAEATAAAYFRKTASGAYEFVRELDGLRGAIDRIAVHGGAANILVVTMKPGDARCCPTGRTELAFNLAGDMTKTASASAMSPDTSGYDLNGLRLGMTVDEVMYRAGSYRPQRTMAQYRFYDVVQAPFVRTIAYQERDHWTRLMFSGPASGNRMFMWSGRYLGGSSNPLREDMVRLLAKIFGPEDDSTGEWSVWRIKNGKHQKCPATGECVPGYAYPIAGSAPGLLLLGDDLDFAQLKRLPFTAGDPDLIVVARITNGYADVQLTDIARLREFAKQDIASVESNVPRPSDSANVGKCSASGVDSSLSGVCPGMQRDEAAAILERAYPERPDLDKYMHPPARENYSTPFELANTGGYSQTWQTSRMYRRFDTPEIPGAIFYIPESTTLFLSGPASGQEVIEVEKNFDWNGRPSQAPSISTVKDQFLKRYGAPANHGYLFNGLPSESRWEWHLRRGKPSSCLIDEVGKQFMPGTMDSTPYCLGPYGGMYMGDFGTDWLTRLRAAFNKRKTPIQGDIRDLGYDLLVVLDWEANFKDPSRMNSMRVRIKDVTRAITDYATDMDALTSDKNKRDAQRSGNAPRL
jgi:hypothetical protein